MFPEHFDGNRFFNPGGKQARGLLQALRWKLTSRPEKSRFLDDVRPVKPEEESDGLRITMVNHSTLLLQFRGYNFLTDPVWSQRASPLGWAGPKRLRRPGIAFEDLPHIDAVLLSHNHYDHLDIATLRRLADRDQPDIVVPLGVAPLVSGMFCTVHEMDWGDSTIVRGVKVHAVPAQHFSARGMLDRDKTLWCGYWVDEVYFAADTGFGAHFQAIQEQFGSPRVALLPIGAYLPRWFMGPVHMNPEDALQAHRILGAQTSIAIHHGTFQLADDALDTPADALRKLLNGDPADFRILANGESWGL